MKKFISKIFAFFLVGLILGELIIWSFKLYVDVPSVYIDKYGLVKNNPNQEGITVWGHKWVVNKFGEYGYEPQNTDSIFTVIGDSYIANTMNPPECHQARYLSLYFDSVDFYPSARGGASFMEFIIMTQSLNQLNPIQHLLYVHHGDFTESIVEIENNKSKVQWSMKTNELRIPTFSQKKYRLKRLLYNFKFGYYIYRNYLVSETSLNTNNRERVKGELDYKKICALLRFIQSNYDTHNLTLVFSPDSDKKLISLVEEFGYKVFELRTEDYDSWKLETDSHWSCYGHKQASSQVANYIRSTRWE